MYKPEIPFARSILHPTDFSDSSYEAFVHALSIALSRRANLSLLHASDARQPDGDWEYFPNVREQLEDWKLLEPGSRRADVLQKLGVRLHKVDAAGSPVSAAMRFLNESPADLLVLATEGRDGLSRFFHPSTAEKLAEAVGLRTLFVPKGARGFVSDDDGSARLQRILVPVAEEPSPRPALVHAADATVLSGGKPIEVIVLHVGDTMPPLRLPAEDGCIWREEVRRGDVIDEILMAADEHGVDMIMMSSDGSNSLREFIQGSHTEQVVREASCPVLCIPQD